MARYLRQEDQAGRSGSDLRLDELWRVAGGHAPRYLAAAALTTACAAVLTVGVVQVGLSYNVLTAVVVVGGALLVAGSAKGSLSHSVNLQRVDLSALRTAAGRRRLTIGLGIGLSFWLGIGLAVGLTVGLTVVPALGLVFGLWLVRRSPWPRYAVACRLLARRRELPPRPAVFLDWAYDAGLVRLSGIAVQFRHREFQAWLTPPSGNPNPPRHRRRPQRRPELP